MSYFQDPVFDLLKLGQSIRQPVSRKSFAKHVVDLAARLSIQSTDARGLIEGRDLLHDQIAKLTWRTYVWFIPVQSFAMGQSGISDVLPNSLLGTAILYRHQMNSSDPEARSYTRLMICTGLEWACYKAQHEGRPNAHGDMPQIERDKLNELVGRP